MLRHGRVPLAINVETADLSLQMAGLDLFPALSDAPAEAIVVADGTSCRHQIADGTARKAIHVVRLLGSAVRRMREGPMLVDALKRPTAA